MHFYYYGFFFLSFLKNQYQKSVTVNVNKVVFCVWPHMMYLFAPLANYFLCQICLNAIHWDTISLLNQWEMAMQPQNARGRVHCKLMTPL